MSREYSLDEAKEILMKATQLKIKLLEKDLQALRKKEGAVSVNSGPKDTSASIAGGGIEGVAQGKLNPPGRNDPLRKEDEESSEESSETSEESSGEESSEASMEPVKKNLDPTQISRSPALASRSKSAGLPKITPQPAEKVGLAAPDRAAAEVTGPSNLPPPGAKEKVLVSNPTLPSAWGTKPTQKAEKEMSGKCEKCGMEKKDHAMEKRCWEGYEAVPGKEPYSKGSCAPAKKAELTDSKGNHKSNSVHPESSMPDDKDPKHYNKPGKDYTNGKGKVPSAAGSGGTIKEHKDLEKSGQSLLYPNDESGWVSTSPNSEGGSGINSRASRGGNYSTSVADSISEAHASQANVDRQRAYDDALNHLNTLPEKHKNVLANAHGILPEHWKDAEAESSDPMPWEDFRDHRLAESIAATTKPIRLKTTPGIGNKFTAAGPLISKSATPPMAKPPSGANMATKVPSSKPGVMKEELDKGVMSDIARRDSDSRTGAPSAPESKVKLPTPEQHADRAAMFGDAMSGAFSPQKHSSPEREDFENTGFARREVARAHGLEAMSGAFSPPPKAPAQKPGIFAKLVGKK